MSAAAWTSKIIVAWQSTRVTIEAYFGVSSAPTECGVTGETR
jgi:hypothetical protein